MGSGVPPRFAWSAIGSSLRVRRPAEPVLGGIMTPSEVLDVGRDAIWVLLELSGPIMLVALVVGLAVALLQALTQVQEVTLVFVPKIIAIFLSLLLMMPYIGMILNGFMTRIGERIAGL